MKIEEQVKLSKLKKGDEFEGKLLIDKIDFLKTRAGKDYASVDFKDDTKFLNGKVWDVDKENFNFETGEVVLVNAEVSEFNGNLQFNLKTLQKLNEDDPDQDPYLFLKKAPIEHEEILEELKKYLNIIKDENPKYFNIVKNLFAKDNNKLLKMFSDHPAAKAVHHNYLRGLAYHTLRMLRHAEKLIEVYPFLNKGLLLSGTLLHDTAKTIELDGVVDTKYSVVGSLLGHISIADSWIVEEAIKLNIDPEKDEEILMLRHMILSHHGTNEWGSPVVPKIPEAAALHSIDKLDAVLTQYEDNYNLMEEGNMSERIFGLQTEIYKPKGDGHILD